MGKYKFNYTVIRFVPEKTLGEFVNIGVILKCSDTGYLGVRLHQWSQRVSHFFKYVDRELYVYAKKSLEAEINKIQKSLKTQKNNIPLLKEDVDEVFSSVVKPLDSAIQFSPVYGGVTDDLEAEIEYLFGKYVMAHIQGPDKRERIKREHIERGIKNTLRQERLASKFTERVIKCKVLSQKFPFVYKNGGAPVVIQPLSFDYDDESYLNDTAYKWKGRLEDLKNDVDFRITIVVAPPREQKFQTHYKHATELLKEFADIVPHSELPDFGKKLKETISV